MKKWIIPALVAFVTLTAITTQAAPSAKCAECCKKDCKACCKADCEKCCGK